MFYWPIFLYCCLSMKKWEDKISRVVKQLPYQVDCANKIYLNFFVCLKCNKKNMRINDFLPTSPVLFTVTWSFQFLAVLFDTNYSPQNAPLCSVFFACVCACMCERDVMAVVVHSKFYSNSTASIYNHSHLQNAFHSGWSKRAFYLKKCRTQPTSSGLCYLMASSSITRVVSN